MMRQVTSAGVVVYRRSSTGVIEYLLLRYSAGHWDFPKGKVEPGESMQEAALRELQEETGLTGTILPDFSHSFGYEFVDYHGQRAYKTVHFFVGTVPDVPVVLSHEHTDSLWLEYDAAYKKLTYTNAQDLVCKAHLFIQNSLF